MTDEKIKEISPQVAWNILNSDKNAVLLDVRTRPEFEFVGHPPNALNVPWQEVLSGQINPDFIDLVREKLQLVRVGSHPESDLTVLAICRSGARSMAAATTLKKSGFRNVMNVAEGFEGSLDNQRQRGNINGWRFHNLPWEQA